jgi:hypothetical protein
METSFYMAKSYFSCRILAKTVANTKNKKQCKLKGMYTSLLLGGVLVTTLPERERREWVIASEAWLHPSFDDGLLKEIFSSSLCINYLRDCSEIEEICAFGFMPNGIFAE